MNNSNDINNKKYLILDTIFKSEKSITASEISEITKMSLERTIRLLGGMYGDRYIIRMTNDGKGYSYRYLTVKGMKRYDNLKEMYAQT